MTVLPNVFASTGPVDSRLGTVISWLQEFMGLESDTIWKLIYIAKCLFGNGQSGSAFVEGERTPWPAVLQNPAQF